MTVGAFLEELTGEIEEDEPWTPVCYQEYFDEWLEEYLREAWSDDVDNDPIGDPIGTAISRVLGWITNLSIPMLLAWTRAIPVKK